jgi:hypothetical protein
MARRVWINAGLRHPIRYPARVGSRVASNGDLYHCTGFPANTGDTTPVGAERRLDEAAGTRESWDDAVLDLVQ